MFILPYWYNINVITAATNLCSQDQLKTALDNTLAIDVQPLENNQVTTYYIIHSHASIIVFPFTIDFNKFKELNEFTSIDSQYHIYCICFRSTLGFSRILGGTFVIR